MTSFNIGSFNINGCRGIEKRAALFDYLQLKKTDIVLLQETHTNVQNQTQWMTEWKGRALLSHGSTLSAGVAILLSSRVNSQAFVSEIISGWILRVDITLGDSNFSFFNVYAPNTGNERISFFEKLSEAVSECSQDKIIVLGGDFNCTLDQAVDRNHEEPHACSDEALRSVINYHSFTDLWRDCFPGVRQYTWLKQNSNELSAARLDRFYVKANNRGRFFGVSISPNFCFFKFLFLVLNLILHIGTLIIIYSRIILLLMLFISFGKLGKRKERVFHP